jgi:hypothetical protein
MYTIITKTQYKNPVNDIQEHINQKPYAQISILFDTYKKAEEYALNREKNNWLPLGQEDKKDRIITYRIEKMNNQSKEVEVLDYFANKVVKRNCTSWYFNQETGITEDF